MKSMVIRIGILTSIVAMMLISIAGMATAEIVLFDCPSNTDRPTTQLGYAHSYFDSNTKIMTYLLDVANKPGAEIIEYCVYPSPGFTGNTNDLTPLYSGWTIDRPGTKTYFGFDSRNAPRISVDGSANIDIGNVKYTDSPSSQLILLHVYDREECGSGEDSCWRTASTSPLPQPTPTPTVTPTPTPTVTPTPTPTVTPTPTPTVTPPGDTEIPTTPLCPVALAIGPTAINVSWLPSTDNVGVMGYRVYRSTDNTNFYYITTTTGTYYTNTGLTTGITYYYVIIAFDAANNPSFPSDVAYATPRDINPPVVIVPSDIMAEATSPSGAVVTFSASATDDIDGSITPICNPASGSTFHLGLTTVTCTATDVAGNVGSMIFSITVVDTTPPTPPSGLAAVAGISTIDLSWTASYDAVGVTRYWIYRSTDNINFVIVGNTAGTTFRDTGLRSDTIYYYYIIAFDGATNPSNKSSIISARTLVPTPTPTPGPTSTSTPGPSPSPTGTVPIPDSPPVITVPSDMIVEATSPLGAVVTFSVSAYDNEDGQSVAVTCDPVSGSIFHIGTTIVICTARDSAGNVGSNTFKITVVDTTPPTAPSGLIATAISTSRIDLSWTASSDIVGVNAYWVFRSLNGISFVPIGSTASTSFSSIGLLSNTTYYYVVVAYDAAANPSDTSNIANARTFVQPPNPPPTPEPSPSPTETVGVEPSPTITINPCSPTANTPRGQTVQVIPTSDVNMRFDVVLQCGDTTAVAYYDNQWTPLPNNYKSTIFYDIDTTSTYVNWITIKIVYPNPPSNIDENSLRLFHYENGNWLDVTTALDTTTNTITGRVTSLSPFGIGGASTGSGGGPGGSGAVMMGPSFDNIGLMILSICLITISIFRLKKKNIK